MHSEVTNLPREDCKTLQHSLINSYFTLSLPLQKGKNLYAFLMESTTLEYNVERKCDLMQIGGWLDYKSYGIAMPFSRFT